jgi:hypothetical protein
MIRAPAAGNVAAAGRERKAMERWKLAAEYSGFRMHKGDALVSVAGDGPRARRLSPKKSQRIRNHSPTGFEWGYEGSGPAQLALAILLDFSGDDAELAQHFYQDFKRHFVARWPSAGAGIQGGWKLAGEVIANWLRAQGAAGNSWREPGGDLDGPEPSPGEAQALLKLAMAPEPASSAGSSAAELAAARLRSRIRRGRGGR